MDMDRLILILYYVNYDYCTDYCLKMLVMRFTDVYSIDWFFLLFNYFI